jgi:Holliday junction DNA helicase RuvB
MNDKLVLHRSNSAGIVDGDHQDMDGDKEIQSLRPERLDDYVGQGELVDTLKIAIEAALKREEPLEHVLFHGPPGLGKTTLAHIIAAEMGGRLTVTSGPALEKGGDLIGILTHLDEGDVFFIDEIHRTPKQVEEFLYGAMEDFAVDFVFDKGIHARSHRYRLNRFTLVGATTRVGLLSAPLRDRFGLLRNLEFYKIAELIQIIKRSAHILNVAVDDDGAKTLALRSRGTPRIVNRLLKRVRDYAQVKGDGRIVQNTVESALALEGVDGKGLTRLDRRYLKTIIDYYHGGPVGIEAIAATLQEESDTLVDVVEPYLLNIGMVMRTSSGRKAPEAAYQHLGYGAREKRFEQPGNG